MREPVDIRYWKSLAVCAGLAAICLAGCDDPTAHKADTTTAGMEVAARRFSEATTKALADIRTGAPLTAKDGFGALRQSMRVYRTARSVSGRLTAEVAVDFGRPGKMSQETYLDFEREPARVSLRVTDPVGGTNHYVADGRNLYRLRAISNSYTRRSAEGDLRALVEVIDRETPLVMNPLTFAVGADRPAGVETAKRVADQKIEGRPAAVIAGNLKASLADRLCSGLFGRQLPPRERGYRLWIDRATSVVVKSELRFSWKPRSGARRLRPSPKNPSLRIVERTHELRLDAAIDPSRFAFTAPPNARERIVSSAAALD